MSHKRIILIIAAAVAAAGLTVTLLFVWGVNPIVILLGAMVASVAVRALAQRK